MAMAVIGLCLPATNCCSRSFTSVASRGALDNYCLWSSRARRTSTWLCNAQGGEGGTRPDAAENPFDLEKEFQKALESEESQAMLRDLAAAAERVSEKRKELDDVTRREKKVEELQSVLERLDSEQASADSVIAETEEEVLKAEAEVRAAELALVMARAGDSASELSSKWETADIDEDSERIESGKAAAVSALAGTLASLPFAFAIDGGPSIGAIFSEVGILISCALFGVTFRYAVRRDVANLQLKSGVAAAFGLVRGIGQIDATQSLVGFSETGFDKLLKASLEAGESMIIFITAAIALDYCLSQNLLLPFPSRKSP